MQIFEGGRPVKTVLTTKEFEWQLGLDIRDFDNVVIEGDVTLRGKKLKGSLSFRRASVNGSFYFEDGNISGDLDLRGISIENDLRLEGSHVGGKLDLTSCRVLGVIDRSASRVAEEEVVIDVQAREYRGPREKRVKIIAKHRRRQAA